MKDFYLVIHIIVQYELKNKTKKRAWIYPTESQSKMARKMFDQSILRPLYGKCRNSTVLVVENSNSIYKVSHGMVNVD